MALFPFKKNRRFHSFLVKQNRLSHQNRIARKRMKVSKIFLNNIKTRLLAKYKFIVLGIAGIVLVVGGAGFLFLSHFFDIANIIVDRNDIVTNITPVLQSMEKYKNKNILFFDSTAVEQELSRDYPEMKYITVQKLLPRTIKIKVGEYDIVSRIKIIGQNKEMFINSIGMIRDISYTKENLPLIEYKANYDLADKSALSLLSVYLSLQDRNMLIKSEELQNILSAKENFEKDFGIPLSSLQYFPLEREVHFVTNKNFSLWIDLTRDIKEQIDKLKKALQDFNITKIDLVYVDLRVRDKIIYCLKKAPCASNDNVQ